MKKRNTNELKHEMVGRWLNAFSALAPSLQQAISKKGSSVPCPVNGGTDGFRLFRDANETGGGVKHSWRVFPQGIDLLMWVNDWSFIKTYDELDAWLGDKPFESGSVHIPKEKNCDDSGLRKWLNRIWSESLTLEDLKAYPARAYFSRRRILTAAQAASNVRFHPQLNYKDKEGKLLGTYGAVLCKVQNNDGTPSQLTRTYIGSNGAKVNLGKRNKSKKMTPSVGKYTKGRQIQLFAPTNGFLGVCEGLETALAVHQAKQFPVWPNLSNTNMYSFVPPPGVHTVLNFVDKDRSKVGESSAEVLREQLESQGIRVIDLLPTIPILDSDEKGVDWADQLIRDPRGFDLLDQALDFIYLH